MMLIEFKQDLVPPIAVSLLDHHLLLQGRVRRDLNLPHLLMLPQLLVLEPAQVLKLLTEKQVMIEVERGQDHHQLLAQVELVLQRPL